MRQHRRASGIATLSLVLSALVVTAPPADAARLHLHRGSRGATVQNLEVRLARLSLLPTSAVDRRYRAATVNAVRQFQFRLGLATTGRVNRPTWNLIVREPARRARLRAPSVLGHRGEITSRSGENTLAAMQHAAPYANFLEFDLHLTADHELVLMHDATLDRTTNCTGTVASWTLADLRARCRVGSQPIPTFDEVAGYAASVGRAIAPELKDTAMSREDLAKVVAVIKAHGLGGRTWVQSVYGSRFATLRSLEPRLRTVLVSMGAPSPSMLTSIRATGVAARLRSLTIPRVHAYHVAHLRVWAWTARTTAEIEMARAMLADAVVTDVPATARALYR